MVFSANDQTNLQSPVFAVTRDDRARLLRCPSKVVWLTGLSGAGKSTLANALEQFMHSKGRLTYILDGDNIRGGLNRDLGFDQTSRDENIRRAAEVARLMADAGVTVLAAFISPLVRQRETARRVIGDKDFIEIYVSTPLEICRRRDPKGLYGKALQGGIQAMTGIDSEYEAPRNPHLIVDTSIETTASAVARISKLLR
ncbi:adenylyl-sulfate kinase [Neorhizobium galegae]|uniref:Adenylyl-sulfate kinase n=1 Tax=Neorhizobium galegae TaxID=399 RepID=A0A6A1TTF4_NEOGA|nr:adenylyl-sulfate kinase [Neorhizobium galegae]KAB1086197.1 adenylyl-sulfate kinase [Neorhizobium galegae]